MMPCAAVRTKTGPPGREHAGRPGAAAVGTRSGRSPRRGDAARPGAAPGLAWPGPGAPLLVVLARSHPADPAWEDRNWHGRAEIRVRGAEYAGPDDRREKRRRVERPGLERPRGGQAARQASRQASRQAAG